MLDELCLVVFIVKGVIFMIYCNNCDFVTDGLLISK